MVQEEEWADHFVLGGHWLGPKCYDRCLQKFKASHIFKYNAMMPFGHRGPRYHNDIGFPSSAILST